MCPSEDEADDSGRSAIAVPVAGRQRARGAIECFADETGRGFGREQLKFAVAVAQQFAAALEILEHRSELEQANEQLRARVTTHARRGSRSPSRPAAAPPPSTRSPPNS